MNNNTILACQNLSKTYNDGRLSVDVFKSLNLEIKMGEQVAIMGTSGAGKSTLLHLLGGLEQPSNGRVLLQGENINTLSEKKRCEIRNQKLGFIYQLHHLLPEFTVLENVCMPMLLRKHPISEIKMRALDLLQKVGLQDRMDHKTVELSGGERQRTAIVRALINQPICVLADEPTGNLDLQTAKQVYDVMLALNRELNTSFVIVTHNQTLANKMDRILTLCDGVLSN